LFRKGEQKMTVEIGILVGVLGVIVSFQAYQLNKTKAVKTDTKESAELKAELGYIRKGVDDIRIDLKANERQMIVLGERITRVEESSKQAHKRIDNLEKEMSSNG
jgi:peptidoglycan hydrolase CwlO-like protein